MVNRIACFLTCGYTEAGAMQCFFKKINENYEYKQFLPNKTKKRKGSPKAINDKISGLSGEKLLEKIYSIMEHHSEEVNLCRAVIIEDDLDGLFYNWEEEQIEEYISNIVKNIKSRLREDMPVFIMYASPEIESWFIADWENGYKYLYQNSGVIKELDYNTREFFVHHLKDYIEKTILKEYKNDLESYGYINGIYVKLSEEIINAIQYGVKEYIKMVPRINKGLVEAICNSQELYYSKKTHGDLMLRNIQPSIVSGKCTRYFRKTFNLIQNIDKGCH